MFYNGKQQGPAIERIGMAVSKDMLHWSRYGKDPVIDNRKGISGDPQIVRIGDLWVMFYFGAGWKRGAFDTFACSHDLVNWTKWDGADLISPSEPWDKTFAHKPWVLKHDGVVYHFYCAVGNEGRAIAAGHVEKAAEAGDQPVKLHSKSSGIALWVGAVSIVWPALATSNAEECVYLFTSFQGNGEKGLQFLYSEDGYSWTASSRILFEASRWPRAIDARSEPGTRTGRNVSSRMDHRLEERPGLWLRAVEGSSCIGPSSVSFRSWRTNRQP